MEAASGVPWIPTYGAEIPIQRVPSGFPGPGGTGSASCAQSDGGGYHQGFRCFVTISNAPVGVGYRASPVATPNARMSFVFMYSRSLFELRMMTIAGPRLLSCTFGLTTLKRRSIGSRTF